MDFFDKGVSLSLSLFYLAVYKLCACCSTLPTLHLPSPVVLVHLVPPLDGFSYLSFVGLFLYLVDWWPSSSFSSDFWRILAIYWADFFWDLWWPEVSEVIN